MSRIEKLEALHRSWQNELKVRLRADLAAVASGRDTIYFFNAQYNPFGIHETHLSLRGCEAYEMAVRISQLRKDLDTFGPSAAETFLDAVATYSNGDPHGLGAARFAAQLLANLEAIWGLPDI